MKTCILSQEIEQAICMKRKSISFCTMRHSLRIQCMYPPMIVCPTQRSPYTYCGNFSDNFLVRGWGFCFNVSDVHKYFVPEKFYGHVSVQGWGSLPPSWAYLVLSPKGLDKRVCPIGMGFCNIHVRFRKLSP